MLNLMFPRIVHDHVDRYFTFERSAEALFFDEDTLRLEPEHALIGLVNWHDIIEQRSFDLHQVVASVLVKDPAQIEQVVEWIKARLADPNYAVQSKHALQEWLMLIDQRGLAGVLEVLSDAGEEARRLRHSSPFGVIMPQKERAEIFQRYEARRPRTHPASV